MKKLRIILILAAAGGFLRSAVSSGVSPPRFRATEIKVAVADDSYLYFSRPVALAYDPESLYALDMDEDKIIVLDKSGRLRFEIGREGQGPGEFQMPTDLDILDERLFVADSGNRRVQILDRRGNYQASFRVPFPPHRLLALDADRIVVTRLPSGLEGPEKVLFGFAASGRLVWKAFDSYFSGDRVYDLMRNRHFIRRGESGEFLLIPGANDRLIRRLDRDGRWLKGAEVSAGIPFQEIKIPAKGGEIKSLRALGWHYAVDGGKIFLLAPERTPDSDLGPGRQVAVLNFRGRVEAYIDLPERATRFAVEGDRIYAFDPDSRLRFFKVKNR